MEITRRIKTEAVVIGTGQEWDLRGVERVVSLVNAPVCVSRIQSCDDLKAAPSFPSVGLNYNFILRNKYVLFEGVSRTVPCSVVFLTAVGLCSVCCSRIILRIH